MSEKLPASTNEQTFDEKVLGLSEVNVMKADPTSGELTPIDVGGGFMTGIDADGNEMHVGPVEVLEAHGHEDVASENLIGRPGRPSRAGTGIAGMEASAEAKLKETAAGKALEAKRNSRETELLNDQAELAIYGLNGRAKYVDLKTGELVNASEKPLKGKIESLRSFGRKTENERNEVADKYAADVESLTDSGLELTQAKLLMDLREKDATDRNALMGQFMTSGMSIANADKKAGDIYAKKDKNRKNIIEDNALMSMDEYRGFIDSKKADTSIGSTPPKPAATKPKAIVADAPQDIPVSSVTNDVNSSDTSGDDKRTPVGPVDSDSNPVNPDYDGPSPEGQQIVPFNKSTDIELYNKPQGTPEMVAEYKALHESFNLARDEYARLSAKSRGGYTGRFGGKYLSRIPGISHIQRGINKLSRKDNKLTEARANYKATYNEVGAVEALGLMRKGKNEQEIKRISAVSGINQDFKLEELTTGYRQDASWSDSKFSRFWMRNSGSTKGNIKKAIAVGAIGGAVGLLAPMLPLVPVIPYLGAAMYAGGAGALTGMNINKRRANTHVLGESLENEEHTQAAHRSTGRHLHKSNVIEDRHDTGEFHSVEDITNLTEMYTTQEIADNRRRVTKAAAAGGIAFKAAGIFKLARNAPDIIDGVFNGSPDTAGKAFDGISDRGGKIHVGPDGPRFPDTAGITPDTPTNVPTSPGDALNNAVTFNEGDGITQGVNTFLENNGLDSLNPSDSYDLYGDLVEKFGEDNLISTNTYEMPNGDAGVLSPGNSTIKPEVAQYILDRMSGAQSLSDLNNLSDLSDLSNISGNLRIQ